MIKYKSTRGGSPEVLSSEAIIKGLALDKGLFVPTHIPIITEDMKARLKNADYKEFAKSIIGSFFEDFSKEEIEACVEGAYTAKFSDDRIAPLVKVGDVHFLELYHGPTSAFKDMALSILPYLLTTSIKKEKDDHKICILTATSGDTGKAALAGFCDVPGTEIIVFYPKLGVSEVQKAQMITQEGDNTHVFGIEGNFDDAQTGVKRIFNDESFNKELEDRGVKLSSANSINIGRLIPQVVYYVYSYHELIKEGAIQDGDSINIVVPTGNFGNILAAYYAGKMGVPINKLICASNENKVLTDFINTGIYDAEREFFATNSPSMDILISSNLERLLYHLSGENAEEVKSLMEELDSKRKYKVSSDIEQGLSKFYGGYATIEETDKTIGDMYRDHDYLLDTHTAVAYKVYRDYVRETGDSSPTVIVSTASPYKFARSVAESIGLESQASDFQYVVSLEKETGIAIPAGLRDLDKKEIKHSEIIPTDEMKEAIIKSLD